MRLVHRLPEQWQQFAYEAVKFGVVGAANTVIDFIVFNLLIHIGPLKANVVSTIVATTTSYLMNRHWTYRDRPRTALRREYTLFFVFNLIGFMIQEIVLGGVKYGLGFTEHDGALVLNVAKAAGIGVAMVFRFWAYRTFVFKPTTAGEPVDAESAVAVLASEPAGSLVQEPLVAHVIADEFAQLTAPLETELRDTDAIEGPAGRR